MEYSQQLLSPVLAAMAALDDATSAHELFVERLASAMDEAGRLDDQLRRVDRNNEEALLAAAQKYAFAITVAQRAAWREQRARLEMRRAQDALEAARRKAHREQLDSLRVELEIDAASIWDEVGQFEARLRQRLERHAAIAAELQFAAHASGEQKALPPASTLVPALGTSGPDLFRALATGVKEHQQHPIRVERPPEPIAAIRVDSPRVVRHASPIEPPPPPAATTITPTSNPPSKRGRLERALRSLGRVIGGED
jgi:hypothetical protein